MSERAASEKTSPPGAGDAEVRTRPRSHTEMIVDDARINRSMLKAIFAKLDLVVVAEATNGAEAIELYDQLRPELVTMDITMPVLDGLSATRAIRARDPESNIVMVTSIGQEPVM